MLRRLGLGMLAGLWCGLACTRKPPEKPVVAVDQWRFYCCKSGPPGRRCENVGFDHVDACEAKGQFGMRCKRSTGCGGPASDCWCCWETPGKRCVKRIHTPALGQDAFRPKPKPKEKPPETKRPAQGTIFDPY